MFFFSVYIIQSILTRSPTPQHQVMIAPPPCLTDARCCSSLLSSSVHIDDILIHHSMAPVATIPLFWLIIFWESSCWCNYTISHLSNCVIVGIFLIYLTKEILTNNVLLQQAVYTWVHPLT